MADALRELRSIAAASPYTDGDGPLHKMVGALQEAADAYRSAAADPGIEGLTGDAITRSAASRARRYDDVQQIVEKVRGYLREADSIRADAASAFNKIPHSYIGYPDEALQRIEDDFDQLAMKVEAAAAELAAITTNAQSAAGAATSPLKLGGYTSNQLAHLSDDKLRDLALRWSMDPETAAAWWASLPAATMLLLTKKAPWLVGSLDGIPATARVAANQVMAADRADDLTEREANRGLSTAEEAELEYLKGVADGDIQLYLYDPARSRIIEMIGTPGPQVTDVLTYSPGTFASSPLFYSGGAQMIASELTGGDPTRLAFVVKDGLYPGESADGSVDYSRILEANDSNSYEVTSDRLVSLQNGLDQDQNIDDARTIGMGHSWGLTNITGSETLGAHYDDVVSLSGAWMPGDWQADTSTDYSDYSYDDVLQMAQATGLVGDGNTPRSDGSGFEYDDYYEGPKPIVIGETPNGPVLDLDAAAKNHDLVASKSWENRLVIDTMKRDLFG